uniref:Putative secreted protein n=1 Tax=Ixodes ricinus TaxID=34613 RepID=A0A0K8RCH9_IXORI
MLARQALFPLSCFVFSFVCFLLQRVNAADGVNMRATDRAALSRVLAADDFITTESFLLNRFQINKEVVLCFYLSAVDGRCWEEQPNSSLQPVWQYCQSLLSYNFQDFQ